MNFAETIFEPIFILGNNRSGTTMLRLILNQHPSIIIPPECHFMLWLYDKYINWCPKDGFKRFVYDLFNSTKFETWQIQKNELLHFLNERKPKDYSEMAALVYIFYGKKHSKDFMFWGDKNSLWTDKLKNIKQLYPKAKYIHLVRDGRDIACSYLKINKKQIHDKYAPNLPTKISEIALLWKQNISEILNFKKIIERNNFYELRYEDILQNPHDTLVNLFNFLTLEYDNNFLFFYKNSKEMEPVQFHKWKELINYPIDPNNSGNYLKQLKKEQIDVFNKIAYSTLSKYSYI